MWGSAVTTAGWEIATLGQWLGLEGEAVLLLGGASYPEIAEHQGTSASAVYARVGRSLTLAPSAHASGADGGTTRVSADNLEQARSDYRADRAGAEGEDVEEAGVGSGASLADRIPTGVVRVAESAVSGPADVAHYRAAGADVVLVGEALVTGDDPAATLASFVDAADQA